MPAITETETSEPETIESDTEIAEPDKPAEEGDGETAESLGAYALLVA